MRPIGFSTGALAKSDFKAGLNLHTEEHLAIELSALRESEIANLVSEIASLSLGQFQHVSVHAPSQRVELSESELFEQLESLAPFVDGIVVHPDLIIEVDNWKVLGERAYIENMDNRKPIGRTVDELQPFFDALPAARFCLDLGHAWQIDPTMRLATELLHAFHSRLAELHISEVDADSRHRPISSKAANDFRAVAELIPENIPAIIESEVQHDELQTELRIVQFALGDVDSIEAS